MWQPYTDEDIYAYYLGEFPVEGRKYFSPFRPDGELPSLSFFYFNNRLYWTDFGGIDLLPNVGTRDGVGFVVQKERFNSRKEAESFILNCLVPNFTEQIDVSKARKRGEVKENPKISIRKTWKNYESDYWKIIKPELIKRRKIYPCESFKYKANGIDFGSRPNDPAFLYIFGNDWKLYRPLTKHKKDKWKSSSVINLIEGWEQLPTNGKTLLVTSSSKDSLTCETYLPIDASISPASEKAFKALLLKSHELNERFKEIYVWFDADKTGLAASYSITNLTGWKAIFSPLWFKDNGMKDQFEMANKSILFFQEFFNRNR